MVKRSKIFTQQPKTRKNPIIADIKSVIKEHSQNSHKLSRAIRQAENISQVSGANKNSDITLYSKTKKSEKITKQSLDSKDYASTYSVKNFEFF